MVYQMLFGDFPFDLTPGAPSLHHQITGALHSEVKLLYPRKISEDAQDFLSQLL